MLHSLACFFVGGLWADEYAGFVLLRLDTMASFHVAGYFAGGNV